MRNYIGLIHKDTDSDYGVSFPDFPGLITAGIDLDDARRMAEDALSLHVEGMVDDDEAVPEPSSLEQIMANPESNGSVAILVTLKSPAPKIVRVNITLPEDVLRQIDSYAASNGLTRSGFIAKAAKRELKIL